MFTFQVQWVRNGREEHSGHQADSYQVQHVDANDERGMGCRTVITLFNPDKDPEELVLDGHHVCYIMNEQGQTVDTIRNQKKQRRRT